MKKLKQTINKLYFGEKLKFEKLLNTIKIDELKNFEKLVSFSVNAIQKRKKLYSMEMVVVLLILNIYRPNYL